MTVMKYTHLIEQVIVHHHGFPQFSSLNSRDHWNIIGNYGITFYTPISLVSSSIHTLSGTLLNQSDTTASSNAIVTCSNYTKFTIQISLNISYYATIIITPLLHMLMFHIFHKSPRMTLIFIRLTLTIPNMAYHYVASHLITPQSNNIPPIVPLSSRNSCPCLNHYEPSVEPYPSQQTMVHNLYNLLQRTLTPYLEPALRLLKKTEQPMPGSSQLDASLICVTPIFLLLAMAL